MKFKTVYWVTFVEERGEAVPPEKLDGQQAQWVVHKMSDRLILWVATVADKEVP